jgi:hypothetical protein
MYHCYNVALQQECATLDNQAYVTSCATNATDPIQRSNCTQTDRQTATQLIPVPCS